MDEAQKQTVPLMQQFNGQLNKRCSTRPWPVKIPADINKKLVALNAQVLSIEVDAYTKAVASLDTTNRNPRPPKCLR